MAEAGHTESFSAMVMSRVVAKYSKTLENHTSGKKVMYRDRVTRQAEIEARGGKATKSNWFRKVGGTTTHTVSTTHAGKLASMVKEGLARCIPPGRTCTKVFEGGGRSVRSVLGNSNPFRRAMCGRPDCPLADNQGGCKEMCYQENIGYVGKCTRCEADQLAQGVNEDDMVANEYDGESGRTLYTRSNQHYEDYSTHVVGSRRHEVSSWMWDHTSEAHGGVISENHKEDYTFRLVGQFRDCLSRQLEEAIRIDSVEQSGHRLGERNKKKVKSLNRKEEHYQPKLVRPNFNPT